MNYFRLEQVPKLQHKYSFYEGFGRQKFLLFWHSYFLTVIDPPLTRYGTSYKLEIDGLLL